MSGTDPTGGQPTGQQPIAEQPTGELPIAEQPTGELPLAELGAIEPATGELPRRSHRAEEPERPLTARLLAPLAAVAVVVAVIVALILINGHNPSPGAAAVTPSIHPSGIGPTGPLGVAPTKVHHHRHHGRAATSPPVATPSSAPTGGSHPQPAPTAMATVQVLNNSRITGLAHQVAAEVQSKGWNVTAVGNLAGVIAESTVYYAPGDQAAARHLAREFDEVQRVLPAREAGLTASGLTLVLTRYWSG